MKPHRSGPAARRFGSLLVLLACSALAAPASATHVPPHEDDGTGTVLLTTVTTGGLVTTVGGIVLTVMVARPDPQAMKSYIRHNAVALHEDLTLGAGPTVDDLARAFGVPEAEVGGFGRALRSRRASLVALIGDGDVDDARTARFVKLVGSVAGS